jgi:hypothetical protein
VSEQHGYGRIAHQDPRDYSHLLRRAAPQLAVPIVRVNKFWPMFNKCLDQGVEGTCVGHGVKHWMLTAPVIQTTPEAEPTAVQLYVEATKRDPWPHNDGDLSTGTTVRAAFKALRDMGYVDAYNWAFDVDTVIDWLCIGGPVVIGVNWYEGMNATDQHGFIRPTGRISGGHCVCINGWNNKLGYATGPNSWGGAWGIHGRFRIAGEDLERLIGEDGEAATALELRLKR